jgi:hypothetical protein
MPTAATSMLRCFESELDHRPSDTSSGVSAQCDNIARKHHDITLIMLRRRHHTTSHECGRRRRSTMLLHSRSFCTTSGAGLSRISVQKVSRSICLRSSEVLRHTERLEASGLERGRRDQHCAGLQLGYLAAFEVLLGLRAGSRHDCEELGRRALGRARRIYHDGFGWSRACVWESDRVGDGRDLVIQQLQLLHQGASMAMLAAQSPEHVLRQHRARHCT